MINAAKANRAAVKAVGAICGAARSPSVKETEIKIANISIAA
jgi:hypothetical protein